MKWKVQERLTLAFYAAVGALGSIALGYFAVGVYLGAFLAEMSLPLSRTACAVLLMVVAVIMLAWSLRVLILAFKHEPKNDKSSVTVQHTDQGNGEVRISVAALDQLVKQAIVGNSEGVVDIKTHLVNHEDSISVRIEMALNSDVHIPNATMLLQTAIKNFIEEFSGIAVRDVSIMVTTIIPVPQQLAISEKNPATPQPAVVISEEETSVDEPEVESPAEEAQASEPLEDSEPLAEAETDTASSDAETFAEDSEGDALESENDEAEIEDADDADEPKRSPEQDGEDR